MNKLSVDISKYVETYDGMLYIPWVTALSLAEWPEQEVITFGPGTGAVRPLFDGGVVAVDQAVTPEGPRQRTWLPITNAKSQAMPLEAITCRDTGDTINRCRARAVAAINGVALCLYAKMTDAREYVRKLGVTVETADLSQVPPMAERKRDKNDKPVGFPFLAWHSAIAAARITDPSFVWSVVEFESVDPATGEICTLPAMKVPGRGWMVAVDVIWKGRKHREFLPIMGPGEVQTRNGPKVIDHQPLEKPDVTDWHRATMRCLAKAIALVTGYGISLYADEIAVSAASSPDELMAEIKRLIAETNADLPKLLAFYGITKLEDADEPMALRIRAGLERKRSQMEVKSGQAESPQGRQTPQAQSPQTEGRRRGEVSSSLPANRNAPAAGDTQQDDPRALRVANILQKAERANVKPEQLVAFAHGVPLEFVEDAMLDRIESSLDTILKSIKPPARRVANG